MFQEQTARDSGRVHEPAERQQRDYPGNKISSNSSFR